MTHGLFDFPESGTKRKSFVTQRISQTLGNFGCLTAYIRGQADMFLQAWLRLENAQSS